MAMGSGRNPPSEVYSRKRECRVAMQMRFPVHIQAMLLRGREAESVEIVQVASGGTIVKGLGCHERWQEYDGEQHWKWRDWNREPQARQWTAYFVQRMKWVRRDGAWHPGQWHWDDLLQGLPDTRNRALIASSAAAWDSVLQEVLLCMIRQIDPVSTCDVSTLLLRTNHSASFGISRHLLPRP